MLPRDIAFAIRKTWPVFIAGLLSLLLLGLIVIVQIPASYVSEARIAIERPDQALADGNDQDQALLYQRVNGIRNTILGRQNLARLVVEHGFVEAEASAEEREQAMGAFLDSVLIDFENISVVNQYTGKLGLLPLGLRVSFTSEAPLTAFMVTTALVDQVLSENQVKDDSNGEHRNRYLATQLANSSSRLAGIERRIAGFKRSNAQMLPELFAGKVKHLEDIDTEIARTREALATQRQQQAGVRAELATSSTEALMFAPDGTRIESAREQLQRLEVEFAGIRSRYSAEHPAYIRVTQQIEALRAHVGNRDTATLERDLNALRTELATRRERYAAEHPDIATVEREIASLDSELRAASDGAAPADTSLPTNPAYNRLLIRQQSVAQELEATTQRLAALQQESRTVAGELQQMPEVEQQLARLNRLRTKEEQTYSALEERLTTAELSWGLRQADLLENLVLMEPPVLPLDPASPHRRLLAVLLLIIATGSATLVSIVRFQLGDQIWRRSDLESLTDVAIIEIADFANAAGGSEEPENPAGTARSAWRTAPARWFSAWPSSGSPALAGEGS